MPVNLSGPMRGVLWMAGAMIFFTILTVLVRYLAATIPAAEQAFVRGIVAVAFMVPWQMRKGLAGFRTRRLGLIGIRAAFIAFGVWTWFYAVGVMPLADAVALHFTLPLFGIVLAMIFLRERPTVHRWAATVVGFCGALVILRPGFAAVELVGLIVLFSAFCYAAGSVITKELVRTEPPDLIVLYMNIFGVLYFAVPAYLTWVPPGPGDWMLLFGLGLSTMGAHICYTRGLTTADASYLFPVEFIRLPMTAGAGIVLFAEALDTWTVVGALIIFASTYYITREGPARAAAADGGRRT
jgi:drug/metabolite transporter (DMT)-like permease